jgi:hypothetical protein
MDATGWQLCPAGGFDVRGVEPLDSATIRSILVSDSEKCLYRLSFVTEEYFYQKSNRKKLLQ